MFANLSGWHFLIVALVVLLLFGAAKLPALARSVGQSAKILKREIRDVNADVPVEDSTAHPVATAEADGTPLTR